MTLAFDTMRNDDARGLDPAFLQDIHDRLERGRREIEQKFLGAGEVLVEAHENMQILVQALDRIAGAFNDKRADQTIGALGQAIADLQDRIVRESERDSELGATMRKLTVIQEEIAKIRAILGYLAACAISTRITAAGNDKFMSFADEIANYVQKAEQEVAGFLKKVTQMAGELDRVGEEHKKVVDLVSSGAGAAAPLLIEAARVIERRRAELEKLAGRAAPVMRAAATKFTKTLTALQVGDMTRQRIEHVQENMRALLDMRRSEAEEAGLHIPALKLFHALTASLSGDFDTDAREIVGALQGVAGDARNILELVRHFENSRAEPAEDVKDRLDAMRHLVEDIEQAGRRSAQADVTVKRLAAELLDTKGDIGNLRHVQGDIRLLAINAYLHCSRMGDLGRTIGAIATEINLEGDKLGRSANAILQALGELGAGGEPAAENRRDLLAELDGVGNSLQEMNKALGGNVHLIASQGEAIAARIETAVAGLDFSGQIGERLAGCAEALRQASDRAGPLPETRAAGASVFSETAFAGYTMQCERDLHIKIFPEARALAPSPAPAAASAAQDDEDDCFL